MTPAPYSASILLLAWRSADTIVAAIDGALAQTVPCEIIISDDSSPDDTYAIAQKHVAGYSGPHRVTVRRTAQNLGLGGHLSELLALAQGEIIVYMAGDDISRPQRVARSLAAFSENPDVYILGSVVDEIDAQGKPLRANVRHMPAQFDLAYFARAGKLVTLLGASIAYRRELYTRFGPIDAMVEDNILCLRAALLGRGLCLDEVLIDYRVHADSLGAWVFARGDDSPQRFRRRYERTVRMYREIAADLERALATAYGLDPTRRRLAAQLVRMYRIEADARSAILERPRWQWLGPIWRGLCQPGLRRKSAERALKLLLPRKWFGLRG